MTLLRFVVACSTALVCAGPAAAQLPSAPEPHLALDELVKEYKRLGLPLPPPNAELVRLKFADRPDQPGFRMPPKPYEGQTYLVGVEYEFRVTNNEPIKSDTDLPPELKPTWIPHRLCLAIQCRVCGRNELAEALYASVVAESSNNQSKLATRLAREVYSVWRPRIWELDSDRKEVLRHLKEVDPERNADIRDLELTVAPRKAKPGTAEFLIDDLTEYWNPGWLRAGWTSTSERERGEAPYWKVAELGFDAVPALLEHLDDRRFTRYTTTPFNDNMLGKPVDPFAVRVNHLASWLLFGLSGETLGDGPEYESVIDPKKARDWWVKAQKVGEEKWLTDRVLPNLVYDGEKLAEAGGTPNRVIARALGAKYPARLAEAYRTVLTKRTPVESEVLARAIVLSKLPREKKLELLEEGISHKEWNHRYTALDALADLDAVAFHKNLIATLKLYPEENLVGLVRRTDDPACWDALAATARQGAVELRLAIIDGTRWATAPDQDKKTRRERIRFLLGFLADEAAGNSPPIQVCDFAAAALASEFEIFGVKPDPKRGPVSRFFVRAAVTKLAAEELERTKK